MYHVTVEGSFSAAHHHGGPESGSIHGHDFVVLVRVAGAELADDVLVDFHEVERDLRAELARLHYQNLNELAAFASGATTPAAIARWLFSRLAPGVDRTREPQLRLAAVEVRDSDRTGAVYEP